MKKFLIVSILIVFSSFIIAPSGSSFAATKAIVKPIAVKKAVVSKRVVVKKLSKKAAKKKKFKKEPLLAAPLLSPDPSFFSRGNS